MKPALNKLAVAALALSLGGCDLAPDFKLPLISGGNFFKEAPKEEPVKLGKDEMGSWKVAEPSADLPRGEWWRVFKDDKLNALEEEAMKGNESIKAMQARVKQARAAAKGARSWLFPGVDGTSDFTRRKLNPASLGFAPGGGLPIQNVATGKLGLSYELDVIGRVRGNWKAAKADAKEAAAQFHSLRLALQADVADMYFGIRALDRDIDILTRGVSLRRANTNILEKKVAAGEITELDLAASVVDLENTRSNLHDAKRQRAELEHALAVALGRAPSQFDMESGWVVSEIPVIPAGLPSALLERRPDVTAAQHALAAANERIGLARAAFFPSLNLTGTGGFESNVLGSLFEWTNRSWAFGPLLSIPVFSGGRAAANLEQKKAAYEESVADYRQQVLEAFRDVEDSLSMLDSLGKQASAQYRAEHAAKRAADIATKRYDAGDLGYLESIAARRDALETERAGVSIKRARLSATVRLIRALGGGWDAPAPQAAQEEKKKNG